MMLPAELIGRALPLFLIGEFMPTYTDARIERADSAGTVDLAFAATALGRGGLGRPSALRTLTRRTFGIGAAEVHSVPRRNI